MKNSVVNYEHKLFLNEQGISGLRDFSASYNTNERQINTLGVGFARSVYGGSLEGSVSMTRDLLYDDPVLAFTGETPVSGTIIYDDDAKVFGFNTGYLVSYSMDAAVGGTPTTNCRFVSFGGFGSGVRNGELDTSGTRDQINKLSSANQGSISVTLNGSGTNRIVALSQSLDIQRFPIYGVNQGKSNLPVQVVTKYPIEVRTNFTVEVDDLDTAQLVDNLISGNYQVFNFRIRESLRGSKEIEDHNFASVDDHNDLPLQDAGSRTLYNFNSVTGKLVSQSINTSVDGVLNVSLGFVDYLNRNK